MFDKDDVIRVKGATQWNGENYTVSKVFQNINDLSERLYEIRWVEPHTHRPVTAVVDGGGFILAPHGIKESGDTAHNK